jgi:hypothetical protein
MPNRHFLAWIEPRGSDEFLAAFVGEPVARQRAPATQLCSSAGEARQWVEREAAAVDIPVKWVPQAPEK